MSRIFLCCQGAYLHIIKLLAYHLKCENIELSKIFYSQVVMFYHLIDRFSSAWLSLDVDCAIVGHNMTREVCSKVCKEVDRLICIVLMACT